MADVFLSCARDDQGVAQIIARYLQDRGLDVFVDHEALVTGNDYSRSISEAMSASRVVVVLLSSRSKRSSWVQQELAQALERKTLVVPVLLDEGAKENWVWPLLSRWQAVEVGEGQKSLDRQLDQLAATVERAARPLAPQLGARSAVHRQRAFSIAAGVLAVLAAVWLLWPRPQGRESAELIALFSRSAEAAMLTPVRSEYRPPVARQTDGITITRPENIERMPALSVLRGTVSNESPDIWVVVHPLQTGAFWVQPRVTKEGGQWTTLVFLGRQGPIDAGKLFEIRAFSAPRIELREGQILSEWPDAAGTSRAVLVRRDREDR